MKSFNDLHKLYWICVKEQNRILTREKERERVRAGYGQVESEERASAVSSSLPEHRGGISRNDETQPFHSPI